MAYIYEKGDPSSGKARWFARIKIGAKFETISLRLLAAGNKRLAESRAQKLQFECDAGALTDETKLWLEDTASRITRLIARAGAEIRTDAVGVDGWESAMKAHLKAMEARDTKRHVPGKALKDEEYTRVQRMMTIRRFVRWAAEQQVKFLARPYTDTLIEFMAFRARSVQPGTLWTKDYSYLCAWGDWMAKRGLCERPARDLIKESLPAKHEPIITLPSWRDDLESLSFYHAQRIQDWHNHDYNRARSWLVVWSLVVLVRGLGCRPSEATRLTWETVNLDECRVRFLASKNKKNRTVPILYQWTYDALVEIGNLTDRKGAVVRTLYGEPFQKLASACALMTRLSKSAGRAPYHLKVAQKLQLNHLIRMGFPPHVVSKWSDHSLSMQERHYMEEQAYFPPDASEDFGTFGVLTKFGQEVRSHLSSYAKDFGVE